MTRRILIGLIACVFAAGCGDDDAAAPSQLPLVFSAVLSPANEVPPVGNAESGGSGTMQISIEATRDASGAFNNGTARVYIQLSGFPGNTRVVGAHIHPGAPGFNGGVMVPTPISTGDPFVLVDGSGEYRTTELAISGASIAAIVANPAGFYFNVHSPLNPPGFARGQLRRVQ